MTLVEFLLSRIGDDEQAARSAGVLQSGTSWEYEPDPTPSPILLVAPARVLAECEAKRRIIEEYREFTKADPDDGMPIYAEDVDEDRLWPAYGGGMFSGLRKAVRLLALPYADHPDYRAEWRP